MAEPTVMERKAFAKSGEAMPDGSYYIRDGAEGASDLDNAIKAVGRGEAAGDDGSAIRRHILKRAAALKLSDKIPDTWLPDGMLKHDGFISDEEDFLMHHGVLGMHWGRKGAHTAADVRAEASRHSAISTQHAQIATQYQKEHEELQNRGTSSTAFKRVYGDHAYAQTDGEFYRKNGQSKAQALQQTDNNLRLLNNHYARSSNRHGAKAAKLNAKADELEKNAATHSDTDDFLVHHGVLGMKWGHRKGASGSGTRAVKVPEGASEDHIRKAVIEDKVKRNGGVHALSNDELKSVNERLNLEQNHARLTSQPSKITKGHNFVKTVVGVGKTGVDAVDTARRINKTVTELTSK